MLNHSNIMVNRILSVLGVLS